MSKVYYITTPIYYINAKPHIGHAYTTIAADILNRFHRSRGQNTYFLTGTDEHGLKIEEAAKKHRQSTQAYADQVSHLFRDLWKHLDIRYDDFIRTTEPRHEARVRAATQILLDSKDIYKGKYSGFYCVSDETYWTETEIAEANAKRPCPADGESSAPAGGTSASAGSPAGKAPLCPECGRPLSRVEEESYFFALSKYQERLLRHYEEHPEFLQPAHRANEILRFVESGLRDLSVSRLKSKVSWGIPLSFDPDHTVYVWFDALLNYVSAAGWVPPGMNPAHLGDHKSHHTAAGHGGVGGRPPFDELWPADVHLVGKEIYRFHAVIWPAMLMALGIPLPRTIFAHGWWTFEGEKMSKSKGNIIDPEEITREFGVDALRYFLFREMPFGNDGAFSWEAFHKRYNADLSKGIGNLLARVVTLVDTNLGGDLPRRPSLDRPFVTKEIADESQEIYRCMERLDFYNALNRIWAAITKLDQYIEREKPWTLQKTDPEKLKLVLFDLVWSLRIIAGWIEPFMPETAAKMHMQLGVRRPIAALSPEEVLAGMKSDEKIHKGPALFPRK